MKCKKWLVGLIGLAGCFMGGGVDAASLFLEPVVLDSRDYTLSVSSAHGSPIPNPGTHTYAWRSSVTCSVDSAVSENGTNYTSTGWSGTGSIPPEGGTTNTGAITLADLNSSIIWNWDAQATDTDGDGMDDAWEMEQFGNLDQTADDDFDADGRTNDEEEADGTDPTDAGSTLGLVAYYPLDGNADDASTNDYGISVSGAQFVNNTLDFDGIDDYLDLNNATIDTSDNFSIALKVRCDDGSGDMFGQYYQTGGVDSRWKWVVRNGEFYFHLGEFYSPNWNRNYATSAVSTNEWHDLILVYDNEDIIQFVDGIEVARSTFLSEEVNKLAACNYTFRFSSNDHVDYFDGAIDDIRIYDRAISSNEVSRLYAATASTNAPSTVKPDLSSLEMTVFDSLGNETGNPAVGETINFEVVVHNTGETNTSGNVLVQIFEGAVPTNLSAYASNDFLIVASGLITKAIPVGGSEPVLIPWTVDAPERMATLSAVAEFEVNRAASQSGSALPVEEESLANNSVGQLVQVGTPSGNYGIEVVSAAPIGLTSGQSFTLSGTANYDWGGTEPVLGALATITVNGEVYTDRTASPDGAWSVLLNGLPASNYTAQIEVDDGRLVESTNVTLVVGSGPLSIDLRVKQIAFESGTYRHVGETGYAVTGDSVMLKALVRNDGNTASGDFAVGFEGASVTTNLSAFTECWITTPSGWTAVAGSSTPTVTVDSGDVVTETSETNNERSCTVVAGAAKPDLLVTDISWSPGSPKDGDAVTLTATIRNQGGAAVVSGSSFDVLFTLDGAPVATETVTLLSDLLPGASTTVQTSWTATAGTHSVSVEADSGLVIDEDFENNNVRTETVSVRQVLPDLRPYYKPYSWRTVSGLSFSPSKPVAGEAVTVSCDIYNNGTVALPAGASFDVLFTVDGATVATETVTLVAELAVGAKVQVSTVWNSTTNGTVSFGVVVDTADAVTEENENNNASSKGLKIYPVADDLAAVGLSFSPLQPLPGSSITLTATLRNNGGAAGGNGETVEFFAGSTNAVDQIGSIVLVADLAEKGGTGTAVLDWTAPSSAGAVPVFAMVNGSVYSKTLTVTENPAPNLQLFSEDISVSPALPNSGENVTVLANIRNTEGSTATNFNVRFSYDRDPGFLVILDTVPVVSLAVGSNTTVTATKAITAVNSAYTVKVEILPDGEQGDADDGDNVATSSFLLADTPRADAGSDTNCFVGQAITFDGSASANASNFVWEIISAPSNSAAVLSGADTATPSFAPDQPGSYELQLVVDNGSQFSAPDTLELSVEWIEWIVESAHGHPIPGVGTNQVFYGILLTNSVEAAVTNGGSLYICTNATTAFDVVVTNHETVVWNWATNYWLEAVANGDGQVAGGDVWVPAGSNVVLAATPFEGWRFDHWLLDETTNRTSQLDVLMTSEKTATAVFAELTLAECVDNHELSWTTGGSSNWVGQIDETSDGQDAARSGEIGDKQICWIETTVQGSGILSFQWKVSSEYRFDGLAFIVDGYDERILTGERDWNEVTYELESDGSHVFRWEYYKDATLSSGEDCGWLDQVVWTPDYVGFALWANTLGLSGDATTLFGQDRDGDGVVNGFEYAFGTNLNNGLLLNMKVVDGLPVAEIPAQELSTVPYVNIHVLGSVDLMDWTLPVIPSSETAPQDCSWFEATVTNSAFFKLEATLVE